VYPSSSANKKRVLTVGIVNKEVTKRTNPKRSLDEVFSGSKLFNIYETRETNRVQSNINE